jgi:hypothetical protein
MLAGTDSSPDRPRPVCLVELASGRERLRFGQHAYWGAPLAFSPNGRWLAGPSESKDGRTGRDVVLWDVSTGHEVHHFAGSGSLTTFAFAPNGRTLASTGFDSTILVWDMTTIRPSRAAAPAPADLPALWDALASDNAAMAYRAIIALRSAEGQAVELLRGKLLPAAPIPAQRLAQLITDLDSPRFVTRQEAEKELIRLADFAAAALQRALVNNPSVELRQRIEKLLKALDLPLKDAELLRQLRAVEVLEHIGTPAAQQLLAELAKGDPEARLTRESQASLERVKRRNP